MADDLDFTGSLRMPAPRPSGASAAPLYVPAVARAFFESAGKEESVPAGTVFFSENEKASRFFLQHDKMYLLLEGEVSLVAKGKPLASPQAGEIFGEMAAISASPRSATAVARSACRVIALDGGLASRALEVGQHGAGEDDDHADDDREAQALVQQHDSPEDGCERDQQRDAGGSHGPKRVHHVVIEQVGDAGRSCSEPDDRGDRR